MHLSGGVISAVDDDSISQGHKEKLIGHEVDGHARARSPRPYFHCSATTYLLKVNGDVN